MKTRRQKSKSCNMEAIWSNATCMILGCQENGFIDDLAKSVSNSGEPESGARWILAFVSRFLEKHDLPSDPIDAFDFCRSEVETLDKLWPGFKLAAEGWEDDTLLPRVAEFVFRRLPHAWESPRANRWAPITVCLSIADKIDNIVSLFFAGCEPTGSSDKYGLRREANRLLAYVAIPLSK